VTTETKQILALAMSLNPGVFGISSTILPVLIGNIPPMALAISWEWTRIKTLESEEEIV
jgi:hypothetical protein